MSHSSCLVIPPGLPLFGRSMGWAVVEMVVNLVWIEEAVAGSAFDVFDESHGFPFLSIAITLRSL